MVLGETYNMAYIVNKHLQQISEVILLWNNHTIE